MRRTRLTILLAFPALLFIFAARRTTTSESLRIDGGELTQSAQVPWTLTSISGRFEARRVNETAVGSVPYDAVVLRRILGTLVIDCGAFAKPFVTDNGSSRTWAYVIARPGTGACASVSGATFVAVGRKGNAEIVTPAVP